jgi:hypothetical protein
MSPELALSRHPATSDLSQFYPSRAYRDHYERRARDAVDALAAQDGAAEVEGEVVWSWRPTERSIMLPTQSPIAIRVGPWVEMSHHLQA